MTDMEDLNQLIDLLMPTWPPEFNVNITDIESNSYDRHPLVHELRALSNSRPCSLPFLSTSEDHWITLAPDADKLHKFVELHRSWLIPSYAWEHPGGAFLRPEQTQAKQSPLFLKFSPQGYYRWCSRKKDFKKVWDRLRSMRELFVKKPKHVQNRRRPLFTLRQQFDLALMEGDRDGAEEIITDIDNRTLDTPSNTSIMKIRMWGRFREFDNIVGHEDLENLIALQLPFSVRCQIIGAVHVDKLFKIEEKDGLDAALEVYKTELDSKFGGLIELCTVEDNLDVARMVAYRTSLTGDPVDLSNATKEIQNDWVIRQLGDRTKVTGYPRATNQEKFWVAMKDGKWKLAQKLGLELLDSDTVNDNQKTVIKVNLSTTLKFEPNEKLLAISEITEDEEDIIRNDWQALHDSIVEKEFENIANLCESNSREPISDNNHNEVHQALKALSELIEDVITDPEFDDHISSKDAIEVLLLQFVQELVAHNDFPKKAYCVCYGALLDCWIKYYQGSRRDKESSLILTLAGGLLEYDESFGSNIFEQINVWWNARPNPSTLPFLADGLELMIETSFDRLELQELWYKGAVVLAGPKVTISPVDYAIWSETGLQLDIDEKTIKSAIGDNPLKITGIKEDILGNASLKKVAIVTLRQPPAEKAADIIKKKTGAKVTIVSEKVATAKTKDAIDADVILFVWACNKHAVYKEFDGVRDRLSYVQGTGSDSIIRSLERFVSKSTRIRQAA